MQTDYLIVGLGISGALLSYNLIKKGKKVIVVDDLRQHTSTRIASGLINPVTGKRVVKTWMIDELLPAALTKYTDLENDLGISVVDECNMLDFHQTPEARDIFYERAAQDNSYLSATTSTDWDSFFNFHYGAGTIAPCLLINLNTILDTWREKLNLTGQFLQEKFDISLCRSSATSVQYKDILAEKIIFCEGAAGFDNPFFSLLPYSRNKGEVLIASIPGLPHNHIYKSGLKVLPWKDDLFWVGSSFAWKYDNLLPTESFRKQAETFLRNFLKLPYTITDHWAAERPSTLEYKPFIGFHPLYPNVGIFNGMGTKGCSLAPYFSAQFADHIISGSPLSPDVDIKRFNRILSRT